MPEWGPLRLVPYIIIIQVTIATDNTRLNSSPSLIIIIIKEVSHTVYIVYTALHTMLAHSLFSLNAALT